MFSTPGVKHLASCEAHTQRGYSDAMPGQRGALMLPSHPPGLFLGFCLFQRTSTFSSYNGTYDITLILSVQHDLIFVQVVCEIVTAISLVSPPTYSYTSFFFFWWKLQRSLSLSKLQYSIINDYHHHAIHPPPGTFLSYTWVCTSGPSHLLLPVTDAFASHP